MRTIKTYFKGAPSYIASSSRHLGGSIREALVTSIGQCPVEAFVEGATTSGGAHFQRCRE